MRPTYAIGLAVLISASSLALPVIVVGHHPPSPGLVEVTASAAAGRLAREAAARHSVRGGQVTAADLRVWRIAPGDYIVGKSMPRNLETSSVSKGEGKTELTMTYDIGAAARAPSGPARNLAGSAAISASWGFVAQGCFSRISNAYGWLDSCYRIDRLVNEGDPRDFYKLEQYGTVGTWSGPPWGKIYAGFVAAVKSSTSSAMSWIDWSPRGSRSGSCVTVPLSISALGIPFNSSGLMCERWNITKYADAGHFNEEWHCGCIVPFGQPYPNTREIDYLQAISVLNGKLAQWSVSAGFTAGP